MTDFENDPVILESMRTCLVIMAKLKGIELKYHPSRYDMVTMLNMMEEMEDVPIRRSLKWRLINFGNDVAIYSLTTALQAMRGFIWLLGKVFGGEVEQWAKKFLIETKEDVNVTNRTR